MWLLAPLQFRPPVQLVIQHQAGRCEFGEEALRFLLFDAADRKTSLHQDVVADLRFRDAREVEFVRCVCGSQSGSLAGWQAHLAAVGQHPNVSELGRSRDGWQPRAITSRRG